jgi:hypothetical protein
MFVYMYVLNVKKEKEVDFECYLLRSRSWLVRGQLAS